MQIDVNIPAYAYPFFAPKRLKGFKGGRGSGKSSTVAIMLVIAAIQSSEFILCCREVQKSLDDSSHGSISKAIERLGVEKLFIVQKYQILCPSSGSRFIFKGLKDTTADNIMSMEGVTKVWIEQAEKITEESLTKLVPTIRAEGSEIWATWNPRHSTDPIETLFDNYKEHALCVHVNYNDNPFFPVVLELDRAICEEMMPDDYAHVWLGAYRQADASRVLLPFRELKQCVGVHVKLSYRPSKSYSYMGLDIADGGADKPAYAIRQESLVLDVQEIRAKDCTKIAQKIWPITSLYNLARIHYDVTGVGAAMKVEFREEARKAGAEKLPFIPDPFLFGGAVVKGEKTYAARKTNAQFFYRANAQGYWNLKLRMLNTIRALNGTPVNLKRCLFFQTDVRKKVLHELAQIEYECDNSDKIRVIKAPRNKPSPNCADAVMMSFARDIAFGLRLGD